MMQASRFVPGIVALLFLAPVLANNVNKSVVLEDGTQSDGESTVNGKISIGVGSIVNGPVETVNGSIVIEENARVEHVETVNGGIRIHSEATTHDVSSVNGAIRIADNVTVDGAISVVNGGIKLDSGTAITNGVSNVNGDIMAVRAEIGGDLQTVSGDVTLTDGTTLRGDLRIEKPKGFSWKGKRRKPTITIGPDTRVLGNIDLEREVRLYISDSAEVGGVTGEMDIDDAVRFSGNSP